MTTAHLNLAQLESIASVGVAAAGPKDVAPILGFIRVIVEGTTLNAVATDRYRIARVTFDLADDAAHVDGQLFLKADDLARYVRSLKSARVNAHAVSITIQDDEARATVTHVDGAAFVSTWLEGNYPPVERLIPDPTDAAAFEPVDATTVRIDWLVDATKLRHPLDGKASKEYPFTLRAKAVESYNGRKKLGPLYLVRKDGPKRLDPSERPTVEYLVMPTTNV